MFTYFTDRDGRFQLKSLAESAFHPLSRSSALALRVEPWVRRPHTGFASDGHDLSRAGRKGAIREGTASAVPLGFLGGHKVHNSVKFCIMAGTAVPRNHRGTGVSPVTDLAV